MSKKILVMLLVLATMVSTMSASAVETGTSSGGGGGGGASINLCEKAINIGHSWGVCDPTDSSKAQGTFSYNAAGTQMDFTASASGLSTPDSTSYSLIYYKDTDPAHVDPSAIAVNVLAQSNQINSGVSFVGTWTSGNIPGTGDVNPRGKIWIVPTNKISGGGLSWDGYGQGATIENYLFESDSLPELGNENLNVQQRMGGIIYTQADAEQITMTAEVLAILQTITVSPLTAIVFPGDNLQFTASGIDSDGLSVPVTPAWNHNAITVGTTINGYGLFTASKFQTPGDIVITASQFNEVGTLIPGTATVTIPEVKSISVDVTEINFGSVSVGETSVPQPVVITNTGNVETEVGMAVSDLTAPNLPAISGDNVDSTELFPYPLEVEGVVTTDLTLHVPSNIHSGTYTGTIEFSTS